jgi:hypothetical protein
MPTLRNPALCTLTASLNKLARPILYQKREIGRRPIKDNGGSSSLDDDLRVSLRKTLGDDALSEEPMLESFFFERNVGEFFFTKIFISTKHKDIKMLLSFA